MFKSSAICAEKSPSDVLCYREHLKTVPVTVIVSRIEVLRVEEGLTMSAKKLRKQQKNIFGSGHLGMNSISV